MDVRSSLSVPNDDLSWNFMRLSHRCSCPWLFRRLCISSIYSGGGDDFMCDHMPDLSSGQFSPSGAIKAGRDPASSPDTVVAA